MTSFISEVRYDSTAAQDFVEVVFDAGTDVSDFKLALYNRAGNFQRSVEFGDAESQSDGYDVYLVDRYTHNFGQINHNTSLAIIDDNGDVVQFVSFEGRSITARNGPAKGDTSTNIGSASNTDSLQSTDGEVYEVTDAATPGTVPCFAPETRIDTPGGPKLVEDICIGDLVQTLDHGLQPVRLTRRCRRDCTDKGQIPVLIPSGTFGWGKPLGRLVVSAHHRILLDGKGQGKGLVDKPALVPAIALVGWRGIRQMQGRDEQDWIHIAFDRHEIIRANGCLTESLLLGPMVTAGLSMFQRQRLNAMFNLAEGISYLNGPPARRLLNYSDTKLILCGRAVQ